MTVHQLRAVVRSLRLEKGWSYGDLAADINRVVGADRVSAATIRRFILDEHRPQELTEYTIRSYIDRVAA